MTDYETIKGIFERRGIPFDVGEETRSNGGVVIRLEFCKDYSRKEKWVGYDFTSALFFSKDSGDLVAVGAWE
jgi:hypothetical protein